MRWGKCRFTRDGRSTFAVAIPASAGTVVTMNRADELTVERSPSISAVNNSAPSITRCIPNRRPNHGASDPKNANDSTGSVVTTPAVVVPMPRPARISSSTGPTLTAVGRRLNASTVKPTSSATCWRRWEITRVVVACVVSTAAGV